MAYVRALTEALPARFVEFLAEAHPQIVAEASAAFDDEEVVKPVDPEHDYVVIRGSWVPGGCDYEAIARLTESGVVELVLIEIDLDPLSIDDIIGP